MLSQFGPIWEMADEGKPVWKQSLNNWFHIESEHEIKMDLVYFPKACSYEQFVAISAKLSKDTWVKAVRISPAALCLFH